MLRKLRRLSQAALLSIGLACAFGASAAADEVTFRLKGGGFDITGDVQSFDGDTYVITSPVFGTMSLDAERFDCIGGACPSGPTGARLITGSLAFGGSNNFSIAGSNTVGNQLMPSLIEAFAEENNLTVTKIVQADPLDLQYKLFDRSKREIATIDLRRHGSSTSFRELEAKTAVLGMASRPIKDAEVAKLQAAGLGNMRDPGSEHILGLDGLVILVSPDSPVVSLSIETVARIFAGEINDWSELGFAPAKINRYAPTPDSGTFDTFKSLVLKPSGVKLDGSTRRTEDHAQQSDWVARDPNGIGVVGIAYLRNAKPLNIETSCGMISAPSVFAMKTEEYPLSRRLYLYTAGEPDNRVARSLLSFSLSARAQPVVKSADFIDQSPESLPFGDQTPRIAFGLNAPREDFDIELMRSLIADIKPARRLSTTFRFRTGSFNLDNKALQDVSRLIETLSDGPYANRDVMLIGFADNVGGFQTNLTLSQNRANAVRDAIRRAEGGGDIANRVETRAYSELAPVACNDNDAGRSFNRRVEVWVN